VGAVVSHLAVYRQRALEALNRLPPFSPILHRLLRALGDEHVTYGQLAELIEKDTVLAGNILRLVNSALYGRRGTVASIPHAISLLGLMRLRNTVLTLSVAQLWTRVDTAPSWSMAQFNLHSVATAIMADLLAQRLPASYPEGAFVAGLLHDLGLLLIATGLPAEYSRIVQVLERENCTLAQAERSVIGLDHAQLTAEALAKWNLPAPVQRAARYHFQPEPVEAGEWPLSRTVWLANALVEISGITVQREIPAPESEIDDVAAAAGAELPLLTLQEEFEREFEPMKEFFPTRPTLSDR